MIEFTLWDIVRNLLLALRWTVALSAIAFAGGGLVGGLLLALRLRFGTGMQRAIAVYVQLFQGTPLLMQLFLAYFGLALLGVEVSAWTNLSNRAPRRSAGMPGPVSATSKTSVAASRRTFTSTRPRAVNFTALETRL